MNQLDLPIRNPALFTAIRQFAISAFELLRSDVQSGADLSFGVSEHRSRDAGTALYEFQPQTAPFVRERLERIHDLPQADEARWVVSSDPACNAYLRAGRADSTIDMEQVARDEILNPLLEALVEANPDFELNEDFLLGKYLTFERLIYSEQRRYAAVTPLWGLRPMLGDLQLADGVWIRRVDPQLFRMEWMEAAQLNWGDMGVDGLPQTVLSFERVVQPDDDETALDPMVAINQVVAVVRALAGGSICAGPFLLERLDLRALAPRPVTAQAARRCGALPSRIDSTIARVLPSALRRLSSDPFGAVARALERYQYAATAQGMTAMRTVFDTLIDIYADERETVSAALRLAAVVGGSVPERRQFVEAMQQAARLERAASAPADEVDQVTRALAAGLRATIAAALVGELPINRLQNYADEVLLGERSRRTLGAAAMRPVVQPQMA